MNTFATWLCALGAGFNLAIALWTGFDVAGGPAVTFGSTLVLSLMALQHN